MAELGEYVNDIREGHYGPRCQHTYELPDLRGRRCGLPADPVHALLCHFHDWPVGTPEWHRLEVLVGMDADLTEAQVSTPGHRVTGSWRLHLLRARLSRASLFGLDLEGSVLTGSDLRNADLRWANLRDVQFPGADLSGADLDGADLGRANLRAANLTGASLVGASLVRADLDEVNLSAADLTGADVRDSYWAFTHAPHAILTDAKVTRFRTAACNFSGAICERADLSEEADTEPKWRDFAPGEFERIYGTLFSVEALFDLGVPMAVLGEMIERVTSSAGGDALTFDALEVRHDGVTARWLTGREHLTEARQHIQSELRDFVVALGLTPTMQTDAQERLASGAILAKLNELALPSGDVLGAGVQLTQKAGDDVERAPLINNVFILNTLAEPYAEEQTPRRIESIDELLRDLSDDQQQELLAQLQKQLGDDPPAIGHGVRDYLSGVASSLTASTFWVGLVELLKRIAEAT